MRLVMLLLLVGLVGCAMTPHQKRTAELIDCTKGFMAYNENVTEASQACMAIYAKPTTRTISSQHPQ